MTKYIIGVDLGTTNCTMAYAETAILEAGMPAPEIKQFGIPQLTAAGTQGEDCSLPSFLYFPLEEEKQISSLDWQKDINYCIGLFARERGSEIADRMISSAKSWLCHDGIDRRVSILPVHSEDEKMSPVAVIKAILVHLKEAWNYKMTEFPFEEQQVLITVPASFDPSARQLVQEAAEEAGYPQAILLEEPQAAFYAWLYQNDESWRDKLNIGDKVLVVDVGGGTTDFSLIAVKDNDGNLGLERVAVGTHLLLGGDNMDLALAYLMKGKLEEEGHDIDDWQLQQLVYACRSAKEKLLGEKPPKEADITIQGRGSSLIGGSITTKLSKDDAFKILVEGFIPLTGPKERSITEKHSGLQQVGLPYAQDPRISCQLAKFLSMTGEQDSKSMKDFEQPTAILFNGGTLKASAFQDRLVKLLNSWSEEQDKPAIEVLADSSLDYAVSRGAVYYGLARQGKGVRIKSGTNHSYFVGIAGAAPAVPGVPPPMVALCVAPLGMEEGSEASLPNQEFALTLGENASFRFFSRAVPKLSGGDEPVVGSLVRQWQTELTELHPIETALDKKDDDGKTICVTLESKVTELGILELWCVAKDQRKWKLEFDIRENVRAGS